MEIDYEKLRKYLLTDNFAFAMSGFEEAFLDIPSIKKATPKELEKIAKRNGVNLSKFRK